MIYPKQAKEHGYHIHVVGMIFKKSGIAKLDEDGKDYFLK